MVANTGVAHLAAAVQTAVVSLFAPVVPGRLLVPVWGAGRPARRPARPLPRQPGRALPGSRPPLPDRWSAPWRRAMRWTSYRARRADRGTRGAPMRLLIWHVHGSWTTAFVQGRHTYLLPLSADRGPYGRGRARTWDWPAVRGRGARSPGSATSRSTPSSCSGRPRRSLTTKLTGRSTGRGPARRLRRAQRPRRERAAHPPSAGRPDRTCASCTSPTSTSCSGTAASTPTTVIEHGIVDPGPMWTGERAARRGGGERAAAPRPVRRDRLAAVLRADRAARRLRHGRQRPAVRRLGIAQRHRPYEDLPQAQMHADLARRRVYLHPFRWTSLGLSLIEAMHLGMPVVASGDHRGRRGGPARRGGAVHQ